MSLLDNLCIDYDVGSLSIVPEISLGQRLRVDITLRGL